MKLMLLAAGEGTRLRPHTLTIPKPAIPFLGVPLAFYSLYLLNSLKLSQIVVNTFHLPEKIHKLFGEFKNNIYFSDEKETIRGSAGGLYLAKHHLENESAFFMMNADEVILPHHEGQFQEALDRHLKENRLATLFVMDHDEVGTKFGGVWTSSEGQVLGFGKIRTPASSEGHHFVGAFILSPRIFSYIPSDAPGNILYDSLVSAISKGENVRIHRLHCDWFETGNPHDFNEATRQCHTLVSSNPKSGSGLYLQNLLAYHNHAQLNALSEYLLTTP